MQADPNDIRRAAGIFKALSHPSRLKIACQLFDGHCTTQKELIRELGWPQSTMARHLSALRDRGLIMATRKGQEVQLELGSAVTRQLLQTVCMWVHPDTGERFSGDLSLAGKGDGS
jgi:DNA-binding transcriptional ArsR family regulator